VKVSSLSAVVDQKQNTSIEVHGDVLLRQDSYMPG